MTGLPSGAVLVGFMGAGKSVVGRAVARMTGASFIDLDALIEAEAGMPIAEIFLSRGEASFREMERRFVLQAVSVPGRIVATGGGAWMDPANREALKGYGPVIHLDVSPESVLQRLGKDDKRPLLRGEDRERKVRELMALRKTAYEEADVTVPTDGLSVPEIAARVASLLRRNRSGAR